MRTGDTVKHIPSGETWVLAWADEHEVICCGWPETYAKVKDCILLDACSDEEHWKLVEQIANLYKHYSGSSYSARASRCYGMVEHRREQECLSIMHL